MKHGVQERPAVPAFADLEIIAQYKRTSHYRIANFRSAVASAKALGMQNDVTKLKEIVSSIYKADQYSSHVGEQLEKAAA